MSIKKLVLVLGLFSGVSSSAVGLFDDLDDITDFPVNLEQATVDDLIIFQASKFIRSFKLKISHKVIDPFNQKQIHEEQIFYIELSDRAKLEELMKKLSCFMQIKNDVKDLTKNSKKLAGNLFFLIHGEKFNLEIFRLELKSLINEMITECKEVLSSEEKKFSLFFKSITDWFDQLTDEDRNEIADKYFSQLNDENSIEEMRKNGSEWIEKVNNSLEIHVQWCEDILKLLD